jgi:CCR4-NOT transcriptional regulation complex NOT5 subunit
MKSTKSANSTSSRLITSNRLPGRHYFVPVLVILFMTSSFAVAEDFDIKFPADLKLNDGDTANGADVNSRTQSRAAAPNELLTPLDPVSTSVVDPLMQEGSPIPDVITPATLEKKKASASAAKAAVVLSATELFDAAKKYETNQEFGRALSSYEDAIKIFRSSRKNFDSALQSQVAQKYAALLKKLNNPQKAALVEKEFGV